MLKAEYCEEVLHKKAIVFGMLILILSLSLTACSKGQDVETWACTVTVPENSNEIILCESVIHSDTGKLYFSNRTNVNVTAFLYESSNTNLPIRETVLHAGGACILCQITPDIDYRVGIMANLSQERDITVMVSEDELSEPFTIMTE